MLDRLAPEHCRLHHDPEESEEEEEDGRASAGQMNGVRDQTRAFECGENNQRPVKERDKQKRANDPADHESDDGIVRVIDPERRYDGDREASAGEKAGDADGKLLQHDGKKSAEQAEPEGQEQGKPDGRILAEVRSELEADGKAESRDEKPEEAAPEKEQSNADQRADDRQRSIHPGKFSDERDQDQSAVG